MIIKDEDGVNVIVFGTGDIEIGAGHLDDPTENWTFVSLTQGKEGAIGRDIKGVNQFGCDPNAMNHDNNLTHTRLIFTDTRSIDVLIDTLEEIKQAMLNEETI